MSDVDREAVIVSIRPEYCDRILDGTKTIEFRRRQLPTTIGYALIWKTGAGGGIVGWCTLGGKTTLPAVKWETARGRGIDLPDLIAYAGGRDAEVTGYYIDDVVKLDQPVRLGIQRGPQFFQYAPADWRHQLAVTRG